MGSSLRLLALVPALALGLWGATPSVAQGAKPTGTVVVYWPNIFLGFMSSANIWIGEMQAGSVKPGSSISIELPVGPHVVAASQLMIITGDRTVQVEPGNTHYVRVDTRIDSIVAGPYGPMATNRFEVLELSPQAALAEIQKDGITAPVKTTLHAPKRAPKMEMGQKRGPAK